MELVDFQFVSALAGGLSAALFWMAVIVNL